jgi:sigma-B regulation protein RsbU (phosphoserine phosphatase)
VENKLDQLSNLREENIRLHKAIDELTIINDLSRVISSTMSLDVIIENIIKRVVKAVHCRQGMITLVDELTPNSMFTLIRTLDSTSNHQQFHLNQNILGWMMINKKPLVVNDFPSDSRFSGVKVEGEIQSLLCVPLLVKNRLIGILAMFNKKENNQFSEDDTRLLSIIATQSAQVLENARLYEQEQKKLAMEKELIAAHEVQMNLLPKSLPQIANFQFAATTIPAKEIGGDFYDIVRVHDDVYEVIVADVAGKGLPAALLATLGKGVLCSQVIQHNSLVTQLKLSNNILRGSIPHKSFITLLLAAIEPKSRTVTVANAGHCYPLLYNSKSRIVDIVQVKGFALNLTDEHQCEPKAIVMEPDDCLILYSDGVDEARSITREFFGIDRLMNIVQQHAQGAAEMLLQKIIDEVKLFSKGVSQSDDITLLVIKAI